MSGVPSRVRDYPEVANDEMTFSIQIPDWYGTGPATLTLGFDNYVSRIADPMEMRWKMPCEKLGEQGWEGVPRRTTEEVRTCGCIYCQLCFDLILHWRVTR